MDNSLFIAVCGVAGALIAVLSTAVGALVWFLKRLVSTTIPDLADKFEVMGERFERVNLAQLAEMQAGRDDCKDEHAAQERRADQRHAEVMAAIKKGQG